MIIVQKIIKSLEKNKTQLTISIFNGMQRLVSAGNSLSVETIATCFHKAEFSPAKQEAATAEEDDPFKDLQDEIDVYESVNQILYQRMSTYLH